MQQDSRLPFDLPAVARKKVDASTKRITTHEQASYSSPHQPWRLTTYDTFSTTSKTSSVHTAGEISTTHSLSTTSYL